MTTTFQQSLDEVARLVKQFSTNRPFYLAPRYKEADVRQEFIDPLFNALGWDVHNTQGAAPYYREVIFEESVGVEGEQRTPDYVFRVGRERKFFAEAKKPGVSIKTDFSPAYQLRSYAWSAKLPLSILTDFEEFAVYDCRSKPSQKDKASTGRTNFYTLDQYADLWRGIWDVFSRPAVLGGSFDQFVESGKTKRGTTTVDNEFLKEIEAWRDTLARNIALRNPRISVSDLNDAVQRTIDRLIFLRMAEDRGTETWGQLRETAERSNIHSRLIDLYDGADKKYNSGLFDFSTRGDTLTTKLKIDDGTLKSIIDDLYFPQSPYQFNLLPLEILGQVYEQFLGKVIHLTAAHQARIDPKPEVKKAGGVVYTPGFIVARIVANTVAKLVEGKTPKEVARLRILDIGCGSGTFLLGAYGYLLDWHLHWYSEHEPEKHKKELYLTAEGYRLTTAEKKRILLNNIYGVDIDRQAVEVTKLSLLLKVLEGEDEETLGKQLSLFKERALPNLDQNIKCGNSLVSPDYFANRLIPDEAELQRVNAFDWEQEFPEVMKQGGFDCIIGNPPYIRIQVMKEWAPLEVEIYKELYETARSGNYDIYVVFVEKALSLLNRNGRMGFILPHKFFNAQYGEPLRQLIANGKHLSQVIHFGDQQVFTGSTTYTCLLFLDKKPSEQVHIFKVTDLDSWRKTGTAIEGTIPASTITAAEWNFAVGKGAALFEKLSQMPMKLGDVADIFVGLQTSADTVFLFKDTTKSNRKLTKVYSKELDKEVEIESALLKPVIRSGNIGRYFATPTALVLFPYELKDGKAQLISEPVMNQRYPNAWKYLTENKSLLANREHGKFKVSGWYQLYPKNLSLWEQPKILIPYMITELAAYYDTNNTYFVNVTTGGFGITINSRHKQYEYLTGLLNSHLLDLFFKQVSTTFHGGYFAANKQYIEQLPIRLINFSDLADRARHDRMVGLVEQMLELHKRLNTAQSDADRELYQRQINSIDSKIDKLVYELYGLTEEEIKIVEGGS